MKNVIVMHIDAFSLIPNKGNPAGVVLNGDDFSTIEMQAIAKEVGFNETAFIVDSEVADFRIRYFTPGEEMNLCGHATMGSIFALHRAGKIKNQKLTIETRAGILSIELEQKGEQLMMTMQHAKPQFVPFTGSRADLAASIGLVIEELDERYPIVYGSTGAWTCIIPIKHLTSFEKMVPQNERFPNILIDMPKSSVHPICFEVRDQENDMHARHFSSPFSGTIEDAITGTGSGVMGAYYKQYVYPAVDLPLTLKVEQGHEIGKDGLVYVHLCEQNDVLDVSISGTATYVQQLTISI